MGRDQHQNAFYTGCGHNEIINTALALDNHDPENGAVWNYEGSHRLPVLPIEDNEERKATNTLNSFNPGPEFNEHCHLFRFFHCNK